MTTESYLNSPAINIKLSQLNKFRIYKLILLLFLISFEALCSNIYAQSGWIKQSALPSNNDHGGVQFLNRNTGYICSGVGRVLKTTDSGLNWTEQNVNDTTYFKYISFVNINTGYICGYAHTDGAGSMFKTTNGGSNWSVISRTRVVRGMTFANANTGYYADTMNVHKTTDGGISWYQTVLPLAVQIGSVYFINPETGFVGATIRYDTTIVFRTTNGGSNWIVTRFNSQYHINSFTFLDSQNGYFACEFLGKTTDGGISWTIMSGTYLPGINVIFVNSNTGFVTGQSFLGYQAISRTTNAGLSWDTSYVSPNFPINSISMVDSGGVFAVGYHGKILKSSNYGGSWDYLCSMGPQDVNSIYFCNQFTGIAIGQGISRSTNGGANWIPLVLKAPLQNVEFKSVVFINGMTGFAAGGYSRAALIKTTNAGLTWDSLWFSNDYTSFDYLCFVNESTGFLLGEPYNYPQTALQKTTNGGNNWTPIHICSDSGGISAICFIDQYTGYIAGKYYNGNYFGDTSEVFKSTDGGISWNRMHINMGRYPDMNSISFPTSRTGYIAGDGYKILKTTNAGINWTLTTLNNVSGINNIKFVNALTGFGVGSGPGGNELIKTTNGGSNWFSQDCSNPAYWGSGLKAIFFLNDSTGWVAGNNAQIFKTTTGGNPIGIRPLSQNVPERFALYQNYPNPFNPVTKIKFDIPSNVKRETPNVKIIIYDILGRTVATLVNDNLKPGTYETDWNASNFASGVYFYQLECGDFVTAKKMVLIK